MKKKDRIILLFIIFFCIIFAFSVIKYKNHIYKERVKEFHAKKFIVIALTKEDKIGNYRANLWGEKYEKINETYDTIINEPYVEKGLDIFKDLMDKKYPEVGYGTKYKLITVDRLRNDYQNVHKEWYDELSDDLEKIILDKRDAFDIVFCCITEAEMQLGYSQRDDFYKEGWLDEIYK